DVINHIGNHHSRFSLFFFSSRRRHTRWPRDWSSDVCSSDLGNLDLVKTNFAGDTPSLYHNLGGANFEDATFQGGLGKHTQYLGWGCGFFDMENDGWADILICNGHVYPEVAQLKTEAGYPQRKLLYKNLRNGRFDD